jgi:hypothetical protein
VTVTSLGVILSDSNQLPSEINFPTPVLSVELAGFYLPSDS